MLRRYAQHDIAGVTMMATRIALLLAIALLAGCAAPKTTTTPNSPAAATTDRSASTAAPSPDRNASTDPCPTRLHEAAGALLLYYARHRDLPESVEVLEKSPGAEDVGDMTCPLSHQPYVYIPAGIPAPNAIGRLVLYDATPAHAGRRWAVLVIPPERPDAALITKVVSIPESHFAQYGRPR